MVPHTNGYELKRPQKRTLKRPPKAQNPTSGGQGLSIFFFTSLTSSGRFCVGQKYGITYQSVWAEKAAEKPDSQKRQAWSFHEFLFHEPKIQYHVPTGLSWKGRWKPEKATERPEVLNLVRFSRGTERRPTRFFLSFLLSVACSLSVKRSVVTLKTETTPVGCY